MKPRELLACAGWSKDAMPSKRRKPNKKTTCLRAHVEGIVQGHSGGMKLCELLACLMTKLSKNKSSPLRALPDSGDVIKAVESSRKLKIHEYHWDMGDGLSRWKAFIYTP
jgi:hypothetical protein